MVKKRNELIYQDNAAEAVSKTECTRCGKNMTYLNWLSTGTNMYCGLCIEDIKRCHWVNQDKMAKIFYDERVLSKLNSSP